MFKGATTVRKGYKKKQGRGCAQGKGGASARQGEGSVRKANKVPGRSKPLGTTRKGQAGPSVQAC